MNTITGNVLLGCSASAALHKGCDLASKLSQAGHRVRCVLTPRAAKLISPQLFEALTGEPAGSTEFGPERRGAMDHIDLSQWADVIVVAPASADLIGRIANGIAGDLLTTTLLATPTSVPRLFSPAMNPIMWEAPAVRRNVARLIEDGWEQADPGSGHMACGVEGTGRMAEPLDLVPRIAALLEQAFNARP
jgi:phosphopantothenoylcysteine decarboxylase / phosphopantothenate---cysteine ligase